MSSIKSIILSLVVLFISLQSCLSKNNTSINRKNSLEQFLENDYILSDENDSIAVYIKVDRPAKYILDNEQTSIWIFNKKTGNYYKLLETIEPTTYVWYKCFNDKYIVHRDSLVAAGDAHILPPNYTDKEIRLIVDGVPDSRNVYSYIVSLDSDSVICLPTNAGFIGLTREENVLIMESYAYYDYCHGGRYSVISFFDYNGNLLSKIEAKTHDDSLCD